MDAREEAKARAAYERAAKGWLNAAPWKELPSDIRAFWLREALKRESHK